MLPPLKRVDNEYANIFVIVGIPTAGSFDFLYTCLLVTPPSPREVMGCPTRALLKEGRVVRAGSESGDEKKDGWKEVLQRDTHPVSPWQGSAAKTAIRGRKDTEGPGTQTLLRLDTCVCVSKMYVCVCKYVPQRIIILMPRQGHRYKRGY